MQGFDVLFERAPQPDIIDRLFTHCKFTRVNAHNYDLSIAGEQILSYSWQPDIVDTVAYAHVGDLTRWGAPSLPIKEERNLLFRAVYAHRVATLADSLAQPWLTDPATRLLYLIAEQFSALGATVVSQETAEPLDLDKRRFDLDKIKGFLQEDGALTATGALREPLPALPAATYGATYVHFAPIIDVVNKGFPALLEK